MFTLPHKTSLPLSAMTLALLAACGGGGGSDGAAAPPVAEAPAPAPAPASPPPAPPPSAQTSYQNFKAIGLVPQSLPAGVGGVGAIRAYADFSGSGRLDLFTATLTYWPPTTPQAATPGKFEIWRKQADGSFVKDVALIPSSSGCVHPRKAIVADFNNDGKPDVFVACHGFDAAPFPGERNKVVLSQPDGTYAVRDAAPDIGFFHSASAADVNGDGKVDVVATNNFDASTVITFLNKGQGVFEREAAPRFPASFGRKNYYSVELVDVDEDGKLDVVLGGHEWENAPTSVLLNPGNFNFSAVTPKVLPAVPNEGVVLDFTLTGTGASRTLWVVRASGGDGTFYQSRTVQKVRWPSLQSTVPLLERPGQWFQWSIPAMVVGKAVIASDDAAAGIAIPID